MTQETELKDIISKLEVNFKEALEQLQALQSPLVSLQTSLNHRRYPATNIPFQRIEDRRRKDGTFGTEEHKKELESLTARFVENQIFPAYTKVTFHTVGSMRPPTQVVAFYTPDEAAAAAWDSGKWFGRESGVVLITGPHMAGSDPRVAAGALDGLIADYKLPKTTHVSSEFLSVWQYAHDDPEVAADFNMGLWPSNKLKVSKNLNNLLNVYSMSDLIRRGELPHGTTLWGDGKTFVHQDKRVVERWDAGTWYVTRDPRIFSVSSEIQKRLEYVTCKDTCVRDLIEESKLPPGSYVVGPQASVYHDDPSAAYAWGRNHHVMVPLSVMSDLREHQGRDNVVYGFNPGYCSLVTKCVAQAIKSSAIPPGTWVEFKKDAVPCWHLAHMSLDVVFKHNRETLHKDLTLMKGIP